MPTVPATAADANDDLIAGFKPFLTVMLGKDRDFDLSGRIELPIDGAAQAIDLHLMRYDDTSFDLELTHAEYAVIIRRRPDVTVLAMPLHKTAFVGRGDVPDVDSLKPLGVVRRLVSESSDVHQSIGMLTLMSAGDMAATIPWLAGTLKLQRDAASKTWKAGNTTVSFPSSGTLSVRSDEAHISLTVVTDVAPAPAADALPDYKVTELTRDELERTLTRGVRRATEVLAPAYSLIQPEQNARRTANGELRWIDGQRVALLSGSPEEVGRAHGELLPEESRRCIESVLYSFGTANTIRTGRWFRSDLEDASARLSPHIPERHKIETRALASALGLEPGLVEVLNVFPELFHCSGFAVFGSATKDGKLYHGRVLDYMTTIGLQDSATTFIVNVDGQIPFANVGYAGFIGSVSGMNAEKISLGEMGGRGEGRWDGAPMATLMRRALEECDSLAEVQTLWSESPRTCEYYYVFADGETNEAVGVAALPESIEFIQPGQSHERLGEGIPDAVVLSAGSRLEELRRRVHDKHGQLDAELGQWLMSRPVAMQSNLHNVLFVPQDGVMFVANATHRKPAAETPYVRIDLRGLLSEMGVEAAPQSKPVAGR
jgi:hypothetical protein